MSRRWPILAIFILSGAAGLIYEVVWARQLVLVFGNTTQAVSAILTGFFGGIAIGSVVGGRIADRVRRPLRMYGLLELILVVVVILTPFTFRLLHNVYAGAFTSLEDNPTLLALIRFGLSLLALGPATILMGATLPTLTRYLSRDPANLSTSFGRLYAANTFGAVLGTIAAGFILIELLGLTGTLLVGAACSAIAGVAALMLDGRRGPLPEPRPEASEPPPVAEPAPLVAPAAPTVRPRLRLALLVAYISGLTSLGYQVLWVRLLASGTGDSTYVFTTILAIFLVGLGLGAVAFNAFRTRIKTINLLAIGQIVIAVLVTVGMLTVIGRGHRAASSADHEFRSLFTKFAGPVAFVVLPATFVMGLTFPATSALGRRPGGPCRWQLRPAPVGQHPGRDHRHVPRPVRGHSPRRLAGRARPDRPAQPGHGRRPCLRRADPGAAAAPGDRWTPASSSLWSWSSSLARGGVRRPEHRSRGGSRRRDRQVGRGRHRVGPGRIDQWRGPALGDRHLDDDPDCRHQADAGPALILRPNSKTN